jgi:hypothetical protein
MIGRMSPSLFEQLSDLAYRIQLTQAHCTVHITSKDQFLQMGAQVRGVNEIIFEGFTLDQDCFLHYCKVMTGEFNKIKFAGCSTSEGITFADILDSSNVVDLSIVSCSVTPDDLSEVLLRINPHAIKRIDISGNNFEESILFEQMLIERIRDIMSLDSLDLAGNRFSFEFITIIKSSLEIK